MGDLLAEQGENRVQLRGRHIARNVLFNWLGTVVNMAVGFFLSPFILHRVGDVAYAVWVLSVSVIGYMNLLDLGMQNSVVRFISKGHTQGDHDGASEVFSAALWVRLQISALVLFVSVGIGLAFPHLFKIPADLAGTAQKSVILIGSSAAIYMFFGVFGGVLSGLNRYDLQNASTFVQTLIRVSGVVAVLHAGYGIVAIATCELVAAVVGNLMNVVLARKLYPQLRIQLRIPRKEVLARIWSYSAYVFLTSVAVQLVYQTDNIVVGAFVGTAAVTFYAIGNSLCRYAMQVVNAMGQTFVPAASTYEAAGDTASLVKLYINGTRVTLMIALPMMLTLMFRGGTFIRLWMGAKYAEESGHVLAILSLSMLLGFANRTAAAIALGIEKHKPLAIQAICEGVANLLLSSLFARHLGIYGVAWGTLIPAALSQMFWPFYLPRIMPISTRDVLFRVWGSMFLSAVPFAVLSFWVDRTFVTHNLFTFALQTCALLPAFAVPVAILFRSFVRSQLVPKMRAMIGATVAVPSSIQSNDSGER